MASSNDKEKEKGKSKHESFYFCYMMINLEPSQKTNTFIQVSCDPFKTVEEINNGVIKSSKCTQSAAPNWTLDMIIGPLDGFPRMEEATSFAEMWRLKSRGIRSRRRRGLELAHDKNLICWDRSLTKN